MVTITELIGSYYEIGRDWGTAFKGKMDEVAQLELGIIANFYQVDIGAVIKLSEKYLPAAKQYDPDFIQVLEGFAQGAEIDFEALFAIRTALEILFFTRPPQGMCTSFAVTGKATLKNQTIIGQNIDWHPGLPIALLKIEWPDGVQQLSLSLGGIWEYTLSSHASSPPFGIVSTLTATPDQTPEVVKVPISMIMGRASRQKNIKDAFSVFSAAKVNLASYLLASGKGEIQGVELGLNSFTELKPEKDTLVHANHYISERYRAHDIFLQYVPDSPLRQQRLTHLIEQEYGKLTPEHFMNFLSDHTNHPKGICAHVDPNSTLPPSATLASVIMVPEKKIMYVAIGNPCENKYMCYDLQAE